MTEPYGGGYQRVWLASNSGRGSFSYADTKVFGDRQLRSSHPAAIWRPGVPTPETPKVVIGGSGGGAKPLGMRFGSYAPGYSPHGVVLIRVFKAG